MKYVNAEDVLPEDLLRQVQKFAAGKLIYVPETISKRPWGENSGYRQFLTDRNREIREKYLSGTTPEQLADEYHLSIESVRRIASRRSDGHSLRYQCSLSSAQEFADAGRLEEWVHAFLLSDGHNKAFSDGLKLTERRYFGPAVMPLSLFTRCCGPEEDMPFRVDGEWFEKRVGALTESLKSNPNMPPLIAHYVDHAFELNDGNHRFEALRRMGAEKYPVIIWITENAECEEFLARFGDLLKS